MAREFFLFVYDVWMSDQPEHGRLSGARPIGQSATAAAFDLVDLTTQGALIPGGTISVRGEVYAVEVSLLAALDVLQGHPLRFKRRPIPLDDGREVEAYTLDPDQARGRRRIRSGDWRLHVSPPVPPPTEHAWSRWAKRRG